MRGVVDTSRRRQSTVIQEVGGATDRPMTAGVFQILITSYLKYYASKRFQNLTPTRPSGKHIYFQFCCHRSCGHLSERSPITFKRVTPGQVCNTTITKNTNVKKRKMKGFYEKLHCLLWCRKLELCLEQTSY